MPRILGLASLYEPLAFLEERIENLNDCDLSETEIHWCDCSPEGTWREVEKVLGKCRFRMKVTHVPARETLYATWNRIILASGWPAGGPAYFSNVNVDDRHHPQYFMKLSSYLDQNPEVMLAAPAWYHTEPGKNGPLVIDVRHPKPKVTMGHFPMWRSSAHLSVGLFDPRMLAVGDSDFWKRLQAKFGWKAFGTIPDPLAAFFWHGNNLYLTARGPNGESGEGFDRSL